MSCHEIPFGGKVWGILIQNEVFHPCPHCYILKLIFLQFLHWPKIFKCLDDDKLKTSGHFLCFPVKTCPGYWEQNRVPKSETCYPQACSEGRLCKLGEIVFQCHQGCVSGQKQPTFSRNC